MRSIGDRAYAGRPEPVAALGRAAAEGLLAEGVMPVIKHMPGHGRATVDSHLACRGSSASRDDAGAHRLPALQAAGRPALGDDRPPAVRGDRSRRRPITVSARGVKEVIRGHIGFDGLLLSRRPLHAGAGRHLGERAARALAAGCDIALHCNGEMAEMIEVAGRTGPMTEPAVRALRGRPQLPRPPSRAGRRGGLDRRGRRLAELLPEWG